MEYTLINCQSKNIISKGSKRGIKRYFCKDCEVLLARKEDQSIYKKLSSKSTSYNDKHSNDYQQNIIDQ